MANTHITITLGRSGQRVVKDPNGAYTNPSVPSGNKRSLAVSFGNNGDHSFSNNKRMRKDVSGRRNYGYNRRRDDSRSRTEDLRETLTRKRMSKPIELQKEECKKIELHKKVSSVIRSVESRDVNHLKSIPSRRGVDETPEVGLMRSFNASPASNGARTRPPDMIPRSSGGISTRRGDFDELQQPQAASMRPVGVSRSEFPLMNEPLNFSRSNMTMLNNMGGALDSVKVVAERPSPGTGGMLRPPNQVVAELPPPGTGGMLRPPNQVNQPLTVVSLLLSLGLEKYVINFRAEEIDMTALKQMGDVDLKELGIPMGPRKKLLFALQALVKRQVIQAHNYLK